MCWALASVALGGLPTLWLLFYFIFGWSKFDEATKQSCCDNRSGTGLADFGYVGGVELSLGRCENCGSYRMAVSYAATTKYAVISEELAEYLLALQGTPELKKVLRKWVG